MGRGAGQAKRTGASAATALETASPDAPDAVLDRIRTSFESFGLNGHQARVLLALLRMGSGSPAQLARVAGVHRTSTYPVLQELRARGLAQQLAGESALWTSPGRDETLNLLRAYHEQRLREVKDRIETTRDLLAEVIPDSSAPTVPYVQLVASASRARAIYDRLISEAEKEVLVLNRPPFSGAVDRSRSERAAAETTGRDEVAPVVLDALRRAVSIRVLYEASSWDDRGAESFRAAMGTYHEAGVQGRIVDDLPMKMVLADRKTTLFAPADPVMREIGFPMNLLVEHEGYSAFQADAFDYRWERARPCPR